MHGRLKRLILKRIAYFCNEPVEYFFDTTKSKLEDFHKLLFEVTSSVPRTVGWILWYSYQRSISKDQRISLKDIEIASEKYYKDSIESYFSQNKFMREPFNLKLEKYHQKQCC